MSEKDIKSQIVELSDNLNKLSKKVDELYEKLSEYIDREDEATSEVMLLTNMFLHGFNNNNKKEINNENEEEEKKKENNYTGVKKNE